MSVFKAFFGLGKIPQVVKFFEFQSFDDVNKMGGAIRALKEQARMSGTQLTKAQERYLDDQMKQVEMVFEKIQQPSTQSGIRSTKSAKVFDLQGNRIDPNKPIMGGTQEIDKAIDNASPGFAGDRKYDAQLVADDLAEKRFGKDFYDLDQKQQMQLYDEAYQGLSKQRFLDKELMKTDNPFSDLVKTTEKGPKGIKEREAEILERMNKSNKKNVGIIKRRKMREEISKVNDQIEEMIESGVNENNPELAKLYDKQNDLELKLDFEDMMSPDPEDFAQGGRAGFANGTGAPSITYDFDKKQESMGPNFETNDPEEALKEIVRRMINVEPAKVPLSKDMQLMFDLNRAKIGGSKDIGGGQLNFGINKGFGRNDTGIGFEFRKQFASGGITALKSLLNYFAKQRGTKGSQQLKDINPKSVPSGIMNIMGPEHRKMLEKNQTDYIESLLGTIKSDKKFLDNKKRIAKQIQKDIDEAGFGDFTNSEKMMAPFIESAMKGDRLDRMKVYDKINVDDAIMDIEQMIKNRRMRESDGRALNATGGRAGFKEGSGMTRRTFLKLLGGMAAIPIVGKFLKPLKTAIGVKKVPMIATDNVPGKPEWFDQLVNKVILEGDDVTKNFATAERQSIHQKTLDDGSVVRVTEDVDDGAVRVEYESVDNMYEDPVQMQYKKPLPDEGDPRPSAEFEVAESGPVGRAQGPDDFDIDIDEVGGQSISDLSSDVSKLKQYATGKGPTMKEIVEIKKRKDKVKAITADSAAEAEEVVRRQGDYDPFASGGIARMLGE